MYAMNEEPPIRKSRQASIDRPEVGSPPRPPPSKRGPKAATPGPVPGLLRPPSLAERLPPKDFYDRKHVTGFLGKRVLVTLPPYGVSSRALVVGRSGVCMKVHHWRKGIYDVALDDGRTVKVKRTHLMLDSAVVHPCDIKMDSRGLKIFDW